MAEKEKKVKVKKVKEDNKVKKTILKKKKQEKKVETSIKVEIKKPKVSRRQKAFDDKKSKLAVKGRQTRWAPVWVVMKKYGVGKKIHPASTTAYKRSWRRTKLHIKPRRIKKWHLG